MEKAEAVRAGGTPRAEPIRRKRAFRRKPVICRNRTIGRNRVSNRNHAISEKMHVVNDAERELSSDFGKSCR